MQRDYFFTGLVQSCKLVCFARVSERLDAATSFEIVEPAPTVAFSSIVSGATKAEFEPIKTPSLMVV
jgi:hypothetical protein